MRDTEQLRRRLWAQIGIPLAAAALLSACDDGSKVKPVKVDPSEAKSSGPKAGAKAANKTKGAGEAGAATAAAGQTTGYTPPSRYDDIPADEFDYFGPPRDPFTEHEEEEGCPNGDWCGSPEDARKFAIDHMPEQLGCPSKIIANAEISNGLSKDDPRWKGFSFHPMMQGRLMSSVTQETRKEAQGKENICCYHWFEYCSGRPLLDGEDMVVAALREGSSWSCEASEVAAPAERPDAALSEQLRARLGELWAEDAQMEHAAIAAFARATLELMAMAAPPDLLGELQIAADDEVEHAMRCFGLAARFSGLEREPGELTPLEPRVRGLVDAEPDSPEVGADWVRLAVDTFVEGCVGETIAALVARRGMRHCEDPATLATLERIVDDEGRHAGLAWQTIRWILDDCGAHREAVAAALDAQAEAMATKAHAACEEPPAADPLAAELASFGRLDRRTELLAQRDAWSELILPTLGAIVHADAEGDGPEAWT